MSHFTTMKTSIKNRRSLIKAMGNLGYDVIEGKTTVRGYYSSSSKKADIVFGKKGHSREIGWKKEKSGEYSAVLDEMDKQDIKGIKQEYAVEEVKRLADRAKLAIVSTEKLKDGSVRVTMVTRGGV